MTDIIHHTSIHSDSGLTRENENLKFYLLIAHLVLRTSLQTSLSPRRPERPLIAQHTLSHKVVFFPHSRRFGLISSVYAPETDDYQTNNRQDRH